MEEDLRIDHILAAVREAGGALDGAHIRVGAGQDDAAVLSPPAGRDVVWTTDDQVEGVHFERAWLAGRGWGAVGRKAVGSCLSDLAAMGAAPLGALLSLGLPRDLPDESVLELARGAGAKLGSCSCPLLGGNLTGTPASVTVSVTALGSVPTSGALTRAGALPGDWLWVSGPVGWARLGLRWLSGGGDPSDPAWQRSLEAFFDPTPRLELGRRLLGRARACMDLSDGLARDLPRLARASGLRAIVRSEDLPKPDPTLAQRIGEEAARLAWLGGEDYELLVAGPADLGDLLEREPIGELVAGPAGTVVLDGVSIEAGGWDHFDHP